MSKETHSFLVEDEARIAELAQRYPVFEGYECATDAHVKNLRRKLGEDARSPRLIRVVRGRGYAFVEDEG